jgi:hypothetical protein
MAMTSTIEAGTTHCPRCAGPLAFNLDAATGGGLQYEVSCPPCHQVYFHISTAERRLSVAA